MKEKKKIDKCKACSVLKTVFILLQFINLKTPYDLTDASNFMNQNKINI